MQFEEPAGSKTTACDNETRAVSHGGNKIVGGTTTKVKQTPPDMFLSKLLSKKKKNSMEEESNDKLGDGAMGTVPHQRGGVSTSVDGAATTSGSQQQQTGDEEPFVNHRLAAWEKRRAEWVASGRTAHGIGGANGNKSGSRTHRRPVLSADATYDDLLTSSRPFSKPVPLFEMVDFLVEVWDEDGLYD